MRRIVRTTLMVTAACGLLTVAHHAAHAGCSAKKQITLNNGKKKMVSRIGRAERTFGGHVLLAKHAFPTSARSESAYIHKVRKNTDKRFWEDKSEPDIKKRKWKLYFAAYFKKPLDDMEVTITLSDISQGYKRQLSSFDQFLDRCATNYTSHMILKREDFGVNKKIQIDVETTRGHYVLATGRFEILGEAEHHSGKADFSDEIKKDKEKDAAAAKALKAQQKEEHKQDKEDMPPPLPGSGKVDYNDPKYNAAPDLDPQKEFPDSTPPPQHKTKGCGCGTSEGGSGTWLLALGVALALVRRRRA